MIVGDFSRYLMPGEHLVWSGEPVRGPRFSSTDILLVPFSLLWGGFAVFWETTVILSRAPFFFRLWGIPFVLVGLYIVAGRFFFDAFVRRNTAYAITDRRVLIIRDRPFGKVVALNLASLPDIGLSEERGGRGTIQFGAAPLLNGRGWSSWTPALDAPPRFIGIENGPAVFAQLQSLLPQRR